MIIEPLNGDSYRWTPLDIVMAMHSCLAHEISLTRGSS